MAKTREDVDRLKAGWEGDPCWDIYDTEGFEEYRDELKAYQEQREEEWTRAAEQRVQAKADELQCSVKLANYFLGLESRLADMNCALEGVYFRNN